MSNSFIYKIIIFLLMNFGASFSTQALECHLGNASGPTLDSQPIGQLKIPANTPIGTRLWTSPTMVINAYCWSYPNVPDGEYVYFYPSAAIDQPRLPAGIGIGLIYDGNDLGLLDSAREQTKNYVYMGRDNPQNKALPYTFQVYLQKTGDIAIGPIGITEIAAFQLDGIWGINVVKGANYQYILTGLDLVEIIPCAATIEVNPPVGVDFGEIPGWSAGDGKVAEKEFNIVATKNGTCDNGFKLNANFELKTDGHSSLADATGINIGNGATLRITDNTNPKAIKFNQIDSFTDMTSQNVVNKNYTASLWANGDAVEGPFSTTLILHVNYF